jgi:hypothetical protein
MQQDKRTDPGEPPPDDLLRVPLVDDADREREHQLVAKAEVDQRVRLLAGDGCEAVHQQRHQDAGRRERVGDGRPRHHL